MLATLFEGRFNTEFPEVSKEEQFPEVLDLTFISVLSVSPRGYLLVWQISDRI